MYVDKYKNVLIHVCASRMSLRWVNRSRAKMPHKNRLGFDRIVDSGILTKNLSLCIGTKAHGQIDIWHSTCNYLSLLHCLCSLFISTHSHIYFILYTMNIGFLRFFFFFFHSIFLEFN